MIFAVFDLLLSALCTNGSFYWPA